MPLSELSLVTNLTWELDKPVTGFQNVIQGQDSIVFSLNGVDTTVFDQLFAVYATLHAGDIQNLDLYSFTNLVSEVTGLQKALAISVTTDGDGILLVQPGATNPLTWFFKDNASGITFPGGSGFTLSWPSTSSGYTVDPTHRNLKLTNTGSADINVRVGVPGTSVGSSSSSSSA